jgi:hypothetical protein
MYGNDVAQLVPTLASNLSDVSNALLEATGRLQTSQDTSVLPSLLGTRPFTGLHSGCMTRAA